MVRLNDIKNIYFIGIGGIGMSAIARYFINRKVVVKGYDKTKTRLTEMLTEEGIEIHYEDSINLLDKEAQLVVYTPAIPQSHAQLQWYKHNGYTVVKRSDVLGIITAGSFNICIAGTHGKTSISTMVGHLLRHTGYGCNAFLGGVSANYGTNFWPSESNVCVIEADEYDRSFLKLHPDISVISSMDPDHLDIYGTAEEMKSTFIEFASKVKEGGALFYKQNLTELKSTLVSRKVTYAPLLEKSHETIRADIQVKNIQNTHNGYRFDVQVFGEVIDGLDLKTGGLHNIENMSVAIGICKLLNISSDKIKQAVLAYKGVKRRFEYIVSTSSGIQYIDDYAHHPRELEALLTSVRELYPGKKVTILFQPHLFTRTRDFAEGFATSLNLADEVLLLPIYPARELPIEGVTSEIIGRNIPGVKMIEMNEVHTWVADHEVEIFLTAGAGDIDTLIPGIKKIIEGK